MDAQIVAYLLVVVGVLMTGAWWTLRSGQAATDKRVDAILRALQSAPGMALATTGGAPSAVPALGALSTGPERASVVAELRGPAGVPMSASDHARALGLELVPVAIPEGLPPSLLVDGDRLLYREGPDADRAILIQVATVALARAARPATPEDVRLLAADLARPALVRHVLA